MNNNQYQNGSENKNNNQNHDAIVNGSLTGQQIQGKQKEYVQWTIKNMQSQANRQIQRNKALIKQVHQFMNARDKFEGEHFYDRKYVYLVSKKWLQEWKKLANYQQIAGFKKISLFKYHQNSSLGCMNEDLVDQNLSPTLKFKPETSLSNFQHYNIALKQSIRQTEDFQYFSQDMWNVIKHYNNIQIKRQIVELPQTKEKLVQIYLQKMIVHFISKDILNEIKAKREEQPPMQIIQFSKFRSFAYFNMMVADMIFDYLSLNSIKEINSNDWNIHFWFFDPAWDTQKFIKRINLTIKFQQSLPEYTVCLNATPTDMGKTLDEQLGIDNPTLVCQVVRSRNENKRICYNSEIGLRSVCPRCLKVKQLEAHCKCKKMTYCSQDCMNSHIEHIKVCSYRGKLKQKSNNGTNQQASNSKNGLVGLINLGNTCFMNSGIQCLSHIHQLTNYFITNAYEPDINLDNLLGTKGTLSRAYTYMMKNLWCKNISTFSPIQFKRNISSFQRMFSGYQQHDAGQFLCYLLNGLHQDLNKIKKKPYFESKDFDDRPDEVIADEQWKNFKQRQNSKIVDLMYGQFRSQVNCMECKYKSVQFDPFLMCSLPIPPIQTIQTNEQKFQLIFQNQQDLSEQIFYFPYRNGESLKDIVQQLRYKKKIPQNKKIIIYAKKSVIQESQLISQITKRYKNWIFARVLTQNQSPHGFNFYITFIYQYAGSKQKFLQKLYKFKYEITQAEVHHILYEKYRIFLDVGEYKQMIKKPLNLKEIKLLSLKYQASNCWICDISSCKGCEFPYTNKPIGQIFKKRNTGSMQYIIKGRIQKQQVQRTVIKSNPDIITLMDCFRYFQEPQTLKKGNEWNCPKCKKQVFARKQMMIYKSPKILMVCLKRFQKKGYYSNKIQSFIEFPVNNLDLTEIVINSSLPENMRPDESELKQKSKVIYDLFAVSYHHGSTGEGHYTAACKNKNKQWYQFNDEKVHLISEDKVINHAAYILFYRRKQV